MFLLITGIKCAGVSRLVEHDKSICHMMGFREIEVIDLFDLKKKLSTKKRRNSTNKYIVEFYDKTRLKIDTNMGLSKLSFKFIEYMLSTYGYNTDKVFIIVGASEMYNQDIDFWEMVKRPDVSVEVIYGADSGNMIDICTKRYHEMKNVDEFDERLKSQIEKYYNDFTNMLIRLDSIKLAYNVHTVDSDILTLDNKINNLGGF